MTQGLGIGGMGALDDVGDAVVFDVSHTPDGAHVAVEELLKIRQGRTTVVLGVLNDKDLEGIAKEFAKVSDAVIATAPNNKRAFPAEKVREEMSRYCKAVTVNGDVGDSLREALERSGKGDTVIVGSGRACLLSIQVRPAHQ